MDDKKYHKMIRTLVTSFPLCGCGSTSRNWSIVRHMLDRSSKQERRETPSFYDPMPEFDLSGTAVEFIAQVMSEAKPSLLEHGGSAGYSWLTDAGKVLLKFMDTNPDADEWPDWAAMCDRREDFAAEAKELNALLTEALQ